MGSDEKEEKSKEDAVIIAVYKLHIHCPECGHAIKKHLTRTEGIHKVEIDVVSSKVTVEGKFNPTKIHERLEKKSRKKIELISSLPKKVEDKPPEKKEIVVRTTVIKVDMHCPKCEDDLKTRMLKLEGVHRVKINSKSQTCTVDGTIDPEKLIKYISKKTRKHAEIVLQKEEKKEEKKDAGSGSKEKKDDEKKEDKCGKKEDLKDIDCVVPYFIHCTHAHHMFSDENPNACSLM